MSDLSESTAVGVGIGVGGLLLVAALVRAGASSLAWWLFWRWKARLLTALLLVALIGAVLVQLARAVVSGR